MRDLHPFLMFCGDQAGRAEEAVNRYCSIFAGSRILSVSRYGPDEGQPEGSVRTAAFELGGHRLTAIDSFAPHHFTFTPAVSIWVDCSSAEELDAAATALSEDGMFLMPIDDYGFSTRFGWVADRYGVTWQLNLA
jgi:predicted 3-demethylubiquinone-9 3-methyltransferase (glyoxalase superfamily)